MERLLWISIVIIMDKVVEDLSLYYFINFQKNFVKNVMFFIIEMKRVMFWFL